MVKAYLRYEPGPVLGAIAAGPGLAYALPDGGLLASGAGESIAVWDARTGGRVRTLTPARSEATGEVAGEVTVLAAGPVVGAGVGANAAAGGSAPPPRGPLASGHSDGRVRLWDWGTGACDAALAGHSGPVTALAWGPPEGGLLASGGADTDVVVWDASAEAGLFRLRGHVGQVTGLAFLRGGRGLVSASKDGHVRVWDLAARACVQTLVPTAAGASAASRAAGAGASATGELWALALDPAGDRVAVAGAGGEVVVFRVEDAEGLAAAAAAAGAAAVAGLTGSGAAAHAAPFLPGAAAGAAPPVLAPHGVLRRVAPERASSLAWVPLERGAPGSLLACACAGRAVEVWAERSPSDARKHAARRAKRKREKAAAREGDTGADATAPPAPPAAAAAVEAGDEMEGRPALRPAARVRSLAARPPPAVATSADPGAGRGGGGHHHARRRAAGRLALGLATNAIEQWDVRCSEGGPGGAGSDPAASAPERVASIEAPGHRSGVRAVALASDARTLASAAGASLKLWSLGGGGGEGVSGGTVLRTADLGGRTGLAALFAPGDRHVAVGTKEGGIALVEVATGGVAWVGGEEEEGAEAGGDGTAPLAQPLPHTGPVWSLAALPDGSGFVSASADHDLKFWEWEVVAGGGGGGGGGGSAAATPRLGARHVRTLRLADDALAVRLTPDGRLLAVALLDSTIQVFYTDSLRFCLALYGHSLPALALDIASDGLLLASGGADKAVRLWGLDFGDCHRALRGHGDAVMALAFVPGTHYLFSASKDRTVRYWDADRWEALLTLDGHTGEVWCLASVPPPPGGGGAALPAGWGGGLVMSGSADRTLRAWTRTDEPFFVEEERERRLESLFDAGAAEAAGRADAAAASTAALTGGGELPGGDGSSAAAASGRAVGEALTSADALAEALASADAEDERAALDAEEAAEAAAAGRPPPRPTAPSPLLLGLSPDAAVLRALRSVRASDLEASLLALPPADAARLLHRLRRLADGSAVLPAGGAAAALLPPSSSPELLVRAAALLARVHAPALAGSGGVAAELAALRAPLRKRASAARDALAGAEAALEHLLRVAKARKAVV